MIKRPKSPDLYQYLLNPLDFAQYLYRWDPTVCCGLTWTDEFNPLGRYVTEKMKSNTDKQGACWVTDGVTSWHQQKAPYINVVAINPRWVRLFNKSLRYLSGGEPEAEIMPYTALNQLGASLSVHFPRSPFWGGNIVWPLYTEGIDDPADRPYGLTHELSKYKLEKIVEVCHEKIRYVVMPFKLGLIRKYISFKVPEYFPLHFGFRNLTNGTIQNIKITAGRGKDISKLILSFEHGQKLAVPNQGGIQVEERAYDNIPF